MLLCMEWDISKLLPSPALVNAHIQHLQLLVQEAKVQVRAWWLWIWC